MINLRGFEIADTEHIIRHLNNEKVIKYLTTKIPYPYTANDASWWINTGSKEGITKAIDVHGKFAGVISVAIGEFQHSRSAEIGYWLGEEFWGKGVASEAVEQMTNQVFSSTEIVRLFAPVFDPNNASIRVLEKCGYELEGIFKKSVFKNGEFYNEHVYARVYS